MAELADETIARVPLQELVGRQFGSYSIRRILGHGSMGVVFEALDTKLGRRVALKVLPPGLGATEKAIQRFVREAQAVAQLSHENIVQIFDTGTEGTSHFYAMQFLDGEPLDAVLKRGPLDPRVAARLVFTAARAIHFAHGKGIIHRDVKPANMILLQRDEAGGDGAAAEERKLVLTDFGLARQEQGEAITDSGAMVGTPLYMSPEQIRAKRGEVDRRSDVYSLGATLYEMVTGRPPFSGESTQEILQKILDEEPRPPRAWATHLPEDLEVVILKALEKEPKRRYASAFELAQDLERFLEGEPIRAHRTTFVGRGLRRLRKHKTIAILSAVVAVISLGSAAAFKVANDASALRLLRSDRDGGDASLSEGNYLSALENYDRALARRDDDDARLGRARALCSIARDWESRRAKDPKVQLPQLERMFPGGVEEIYAKAGPDATRVAQHRPDDALALFYRGFLRWRDPTYRSAGVEDLKAAEVLSGKDWRALLEFASFRLGLSSTPNFPADTRGQLLQQALTNVSDALKVMHAQADADGATPSGVFLKELAHAHRMRADVYKVLFDTSGGARLYVKLCFNDCEKALEYDSRDDRTNLLHDWSEKLIKEDEKMRAQASPAPVSADAPARPNVTESFLRVIRDPSENAKNDLLNAILEKGGELISSTSDGIKSEVMDKIVNPFVPTAGAAGVAVAAVSDADRAAAESEAELGRAILKPAAEGGELRPEARRSARDHLKSAVEKNPRSAQLLYELAAVEQELDELQAAHDHLKRATDLAKSDALYFHRLALVCDQLHLPAEALQSERRTVELAPGTPEFVAKRAAFAIAAARAAIAEARGALLSEARSSIAELETLAHDDPAIATLKSDLASLEAAEPKRGG
jgi:serine/threonine protein kinase